MQAQLEVYTLGNERVTSTDLLNVPQFQEGVILLTLVVDQQCTISLLVKIFAAGSLSSRLAREDGRCKRTWHCLPEWNTDTL